jgi:acyl-CoA thioester hydrolase
VHFIGLCEHAGVARHLYRCPLRWADMDALGHVNNVTYVDYLQEARVDMLREHARSREGEALAEGVVVVRHVVSYVDPLVFRPEPVSVELWVTEIKGASFTLATEVYDDDPSREGGRRVYLRAESVLAPFVFEKEAPRRITAPERSFLEQFHEPRGERLGATAPVAQVEPPRRFHYPCQVRFSDVDAYRHVNNVKFVEYFQEARLQLVSGLAEAHAVRVTEETDFAVVVGHTDIDYRGPLVLREQPYDVEVWISSTGRTSIVVDGEIRDGDAVLSRCRVVLVRIDPTRQRPLPLTDDEKRLLVSDATHVGPGASES